MHIADMHVSQAQCACCDIEIPVSITVDENDNVLEVINFPGDAKAYINRKGDLEAVHVACK